MANQPYQPRQSYSAPKPEVKAPEKEFKTPGGTILPFAMLGQSKKDDAGNWTKIFTPYLQVAHRLVWFREERPEWAIETEIEKWSVTHKAVLFKATIKNEQGRIIATGRKYENAANFSDYLEKAETGAIGRALAMCGYGTQFAPELDEGERIVDAPVKQQQKALERPLPPVQTGSAAARAEERHAKPEQPEEPTPENNEEVEEDKPF